MLSGSDGYKEVSSSLLPIYGGEYHSVMLRKSKINKELFPYTSFDTSTLFTPPFITGSLSAHKGELEIVSSSNVARVGTKSLRHKNTSTGGISLSQLYKDTPTLTVNVFPSTESIKS